MISRIFKTKPIACGCFWVVGCVLAGGCSREPFPLVNVEGKVTYADGELIPAESLLIRFVPLSDPRDTKTHPRPGTTFVDEDGTFQRVTTHKANDGIVRGRHKVLIKATADTEVVPAKYLRFEATPLEVDTADSPFHLKIERP